MVSEISDICGVCVLACRWVTVVVGGLCSHIVFFFQAEDGIRDLTVTGVQTCALPILLAFGPDGRPCFVGLDTDSGMTRRIADLRAEVDLRQLESEWLVSVERAVLKKPRSGERRGGEEGRTRGLPYPLKKKTALKGVVR